MLVIESPASHVESVKLNDIIALESELPNGAWFPSANKRTLPKPSTATLLLRPERLLPL